MLRTVSSVVLGYVIFAVSAFLLFRVAKVHAHPTAWEAFVALTAAFTPVWPSTAYAIVVFLT